MVLMRRNKTYVPMSEHIRKLGLKYDTVLTRIIRLNEKLDTLPGGRTVIFEDNHPIFRKVVEK